MSEPIRVELSGRNAEKFRQAFSDLSGIIIEGVMALVPEEDDELKKVTSKLVTSITEITAGWAKANLERPSLENEEIIARTVNLFEEAKLKRAQCESQKIANESAKLDLMVKRVETALKLIGMLSNNFLLEGDKLTLVLTNQELAMLNADIRALQQEPGYVD
jgi:hypothetical protein